MTNDGGVAWTFVKLVKSFLKKSKIYYVLKGTVFWFLKATEKFLRDCRADK